jgi:hypothetical protein
MTHRTCGKVTVQFHDSRPRCVCFLMNGYSDFPVRLKELYRNPPAGKDWVSIYAVAKLQTRNAECDYKLQQPLSIAWQQEH